MVFGGQSQWDDRINKFFLLHDVLMQIIKKNCFLCNKRQYSMISCIRIPPEGSKPTMHPSLHNNTIRSCLHQQAVLYFTYFFLFSWLLKFYISQHRDNSIFRYTTTSITPSCFIFSIFLSIWLVSSESFDVLRSIRMINFEQMTL